MAEEARLGAEAVAAKEAADSEAAAAKAAQKKEAADSKPKTKKSVFGGGFGFGTMPGFNIAAQFEKMTAAMDERLKQAFRMRELQRLD